MFILGSMVLIRHLIGYCAAGMSTLISGSGFCDLTWYDDYIFHGHEPKKAVYISVFQTDTKTRGWTRITLKSDIIPILVLLTSWIYPYGDPHGRHTKQSATNYASKFETESE